MNYLALFVRFIAGSFNEFLDRNGPYMAAAISFYSFFSLFPLMLALTAVFGLFLGIEDFQDTLIAGLREQIPVLQEADDTFLETFFANIRSGTVIIPAVAAVGLFWASTAVFGSIRKSINTIWGIKKTRPFLYERLMDFSLMFGAALLLFGSVFSTAILSWFGEFSAILFPDAPVSDPAVWRKLAVAVPPLLTFLVFLILYWWLPNIKLRLKEVWPTALAGMVAFEIAKYVFILYLQNVSGLTSTIYGTLSTVIVLMAFVYTGAIILLVGAMLTARYSQYLANRDQERQNEVLAQSLDRVRSTPALPGIPDQVVPSGAAEDEKRRSRG